jgi:hypothetical protein
MHDDSVTTTWKRLTDKVKRVWGEGVDDALAKTARATLSQTTCAAVAPESLPAAVPHADSMRLKEGVSTAAAAYRTDRDAEAIRQAAPLATWEDEGGMTSG